MIGKGVGYLKHLTCQSHYPVECEPKNWKVAIETAIGSNETGTGNTISIDCGIFSMDLDNNI